MIEFLKFKFEFKFLVVKLCIRQILSSTRKHFKIGYNQGHCKEDINSISNKNARVNSSY